MPRTLLVLFGHRNSPTGELSRIAIGRCKAAADLLAAHPDAEILLTAGYPRHANGSLRPHWAYLAQQLQAFGVSPERIRSGPTSATTIDEALRARKHAVDGGYTRIIGVTSDFHRERVDFLVQRLLPEFNVEVVGVPAGEEFTPALRRAERTSFDYLKATWVAPPLYQRGAAFPAQAHDSARAERRQHEQHCFWLMLLLPALLVLALVVFHALDAGAAKLAVLAIAGAAAYAGFATYFRAARLARMARMFLRAIETGFDATGFLSGIDVADLHHGMPPVELAAKVLVAAAALAAVLALIGAWLA